MGGRVDAMSVDKAVTKDFVAKLLAVVEAAKDGVGFDDMDEGIALTMALPGVVAEFKKDKTGAALMLVSDLTEAVHDERG